MKLTFCGAAQQVTGSMYLLEIEDYRILIDCGSDFDIEEQDKLLQYQRQKSVFPFEPSMINIVLLTHAHIDHSGNIPNLYKEGFEGQVICTEPTRDLTSLLLSDAANLHLRRLNQLQGTGKKKKNKKIAPAIPPDMYLEKQVREAMDNFVGVTFNKRYKIADHVNVTFIPAGHLLGAAHIYIEAWEHGEKKTICFSGDLGRKNYPLLIDPEKVPQADYLVCETTYGNRLHEDHNLPEDALGAVIKQTCVDIPGRLIIPSFSVGRTQALLFTLNKLYEQGKMPPLKVFSDSPLAHASTRVYQRFHRMLNKEAKEFQQDTDSLFDFDNLIYLESNDASRALVNYNEPCIIISSSGMVQGGRVEYHVAANISNPYSTILMVGYAPEGTMGHRLLNGQSSVAINGKVYPVRAKTMKIDNFSGHGDQTDLLDFVSNQSADKLRKLFLVHGDQTSMIEFKEILDNRGYPQTEIPCKGQTFEL